MTRLSTSFARKRELIIVDAEISGPVATTEARLVVDTGAAATTLVPEVIGRIGYTQRDSYKKARVHTAGGEEHGYWLHVAEFTVLGVTTPDFALAIPGGDGYVFAVDKSPNLVRVRPRRAATDADRHTPPPS
jgi:predicted aspartyl protease